jgi:hypothetical protein
VLYDLVPSDETTLPMFEDQVRRNRGLEAVDRLNRAYGRCRVTMACALPAQGAKHDKIAFGKVQELG